jgi:sugar lactone lactonase YvrE
MQKQEASMSEVEMLLDAQAVLGEGAAWHIPSQRLYWVDILGESVHIFDPASSSDRVIPVGEPVGTLAPRQTGGLILALKSGLYFMDDGSGEQEFIASPEKHLPNNRFNDGKCDPAGRFWVGTMGAPGTGNLYRLDTDLHVNLVLDRITTSNGLTWSPDFRTMYYTDTPTMEIWAFDFDFASGSISNRRTAVRVAVEDGKPDGMTIDTEGMLWVAMWEGWQVIRYNPINGEKLSTIPLPVARVSSVAFGGPDLTDLYITTAHMNMPLEQRINQPYAGGLFRARPGAKGLPGFSFKG